MENNEDLLNDSDFDREYNYEKEKRKGNQIESEYFNFLNGEITNIINATTEYYTLQKKYTNLNNIVKNDKYIKDFINGFQPPLVSFKNRIITTTIFPQDETLRNEYLIELKEELKSKGQNLKDVNYTFFHSLIYRFDEKHNKIEWKPVYLLNSNISEVKNLNKSGQFYYDIENDFFDEKSITEFRKSRTRFKKIRKIKIFALCFIFTSIFGSSFYLKQIINYFQDNENYSFFVIFFSILKYSLNGLFALIPIFLLSIGILYILWNLNLFNEFKLRNSLNDLDDFRFGPLLIFFIIITSIIITVFNYFLYFNFNYFKLFDLI